MLEFKSENGYYWDEKENIKNNILLKIDRNDEKIKKLLLWKKGDIQEIKIISPIDNKEFFIRKIKHLSIYDNVFIVTW